MRHFPRSGMGLAYSLLPMILLTLVAGEVRGQQPRASRTVRQVVPASATACQSCEPAPLGTFAPTPYIMARGNWPAGGGYTPLVGNDSDQSMALYGPLSPFRAVSAPVQTYTRGYDGRVYAFRGTSASTPNLPALSPVVYPTPATSYYGPRESRGPASWSSGWGWIDQR